MCKLKEQKSCKGSMVSSLGNIKVFFFLELFNLSFYMYTVSNKHNECLACFVFIFFRSRLLTHCYCYACFFFSMIHLLYIRYQGIQHNPTFKIKSFTNMHDHGIKTALRHDNWKEHHDNYDYNKPACLKQSSRPPWRTTVLLEALQYGQWKKVTWSNTSLMHTAFM